LSVRQLPRWPWLALFLCAGLLPFAAGAAGKTPAHGASRPAAHAKAQPKDVDEDADAGFDHKDDDDPADDDADDAAAMADADREDAEQKDGSDEESATEYAVDAIHANKAYTVTSSSAEHLRIEPPKLPDLSPYTSKSLMAKIRRTPAGHARVATMLGEDAFKAFMGGDERLREWAMRQFSTPKAIYIEGGYVTPKDLARQLPKQYFEETAKGVYVARLPIDVRPGATLHIGSEVKEFRLSLDRGAFLVSEGKIFITESRVLAWNEAENQPARWVDERKFRPFVLAWGGSELYIDRSVVAHLGYAKSKSYGVALSQFSPTLKVKMNRSRPTGWLLDSEFYDNWYGFYCYEADDVVIRGNVYHDNIHYGIDPHDRSERLIIAENTAYNTRDKHGIIVSREVNDSWIFRNHSYQNHLSGIVIDRNSVNNVIAQNQVYRNQSDGITIYESPNTRIWQNVAAGNWRHGIRVRNSIDMKLYDNVAIDNNLAGIYGHIKDLHDTGRNLKLDPFHATVSMTVVGGQLVSNGSGPITIDQPLSLELYDVDLRAPRRQLGIKLTGVLGKYQDQVLDLLMRQHQAVVVRPATQLSDARN
jgi:poly(beta-D-mannuronate) C5 epimerase